MNDVIINVNEKTGVSYKKYLNQKLGNQHQNLQNKLKFEFTDTDNIPEGIAWLEYEIDGNKNYALMEKYDKGYQIDIKSCLLTGSHVEVDLKITEEETPEGVPIFVSSIVNFEVERTINAEEEEPDQYPSWFDNANKVLKEASNLDLDVSKVGDTSTITITKKDGTQKIVEVYDGTDGSGTGGTGENGATFTPSVSEDGVISWTNDKGLDNPSPINIKGPKGDIGEKGNSGNDGISVSSIIQTTTSSESGGTNIITATLSDGTTSNFNIMNGAKGDRGEKGDTGQDGYTPIKGVDYFDGEQGPQGEPGVDGANGTDGQSATITIGTVTTLDAGSNATVENVGTSTNAIFNFGIPKGADGTSGTGGTGNVSSTTINSIEVVDSLPTTEVEGVLYLVKETIETPTEPTNLWVNPTVLNSYYIVSDDGSIGTEGSIQKTAYISCEPSTTYRITRTMAGYRFIIGSYTSTPVNGSIASKYLVASELYDMNFTTTENDKYLAIYYFGGSETLDATELLNDIVVTKLELINLFTGSDIMTSTSGSEYTSPKSRNGITYTFSAGTPTILTNGTTTTNSIQGFKQTNVLEAGKTYKIYADNIQGTVDLGTKTNAFELTIRDTYSSSSSYAKYFVGYIETQPSSEYTFIPTDDITEWYLMIQQRSSEVTVTNYSFDVHVEEVV